jgi:alpha-amylase
MQKRLTMKKNLVGIISFFIIASASALRAENVGVPAESEDVMLQVFYWDSYKTKTSTDSKFGRTKWIDLLKDTAAINANFDVVWFPPSAGPTGCGVGYSAKQYSNQESDWGTKTALNNLITALHKGNTKVLADVVLNHRGNLTNWCNFFTDNFGSYGTYQLTQQHICRNDEGFTDAKSSCYNASYTDRGANDTGDNFSGARDLDHQNEYVQNWSKAYTQWLLGSMKYDGFRYDMTLGFHGRYLKMYNEAANPYISVSELWHSIDRQKQHLQECEYNTMVFDFQNKYSLKGIVEGSYGKLNKDKTYNGLRKEGLARYAVTFIDNHDTFDRGGAYGDNQFTPTTDLTTATNKNYVLQASAYILMMPGIPCVFYPHWASYKEEINEMIAVRKRAGIHSESQVLAEESGQYRYKATIQGHRGQVMVCVGKYRQKDEVEGFVKVVEGGERGEYSIYLKENAQGVENVQGNKAQCTKMLKDGQLYLQMGEQVYDIMGKRVK